MARNNPVFPDEYRAFVLKCWRYSYAPWLDSARLHALAMLVSEATEYLDNPSDDEAGDIVWATEALAAAYGLPPLQTETDGVIPRGMLSRGVAIAAQSCQKIAQGGAFDAWLPQLAAALESVRNIALADRAQSIIMGNMEKLTLRYNGAAYNAAADAARLDKLEATE